MNESSLSGSGLSARQKGQAVTINLESMKYFQTSPEGVPVIVPDESPSPQGNAVEPTTPTASFGEQPLSDAVPAKSTDSTPWPGGLTFVCCWLGLIGVLGIGGAFFSAIGLMIPPQVITVDQIEGEMSYQMKRKIADASAKQAAVSKQYLPVRAYQLLMQVGISVAFLVSIFWMFHRNARGRRWAVTACYVAIFYHVCAIGFSIFMMGNMGVGEIMDAAITEAAAKENMTSAEVEAARNSAMGIAAGVMIIGVGIMFVIKAALYGGFAFYLNRDRVKKVFGENDSRASIEPISRDVAGAPA